MGYLSSLKEFGRLSRMTIGLSALCLTATSSVSQPAAGPSFSDDDVSWLFPAPHSTSDLPNLIVIKDVGGQNPVWSAVAFQSFLSIVEGNASQVPETNSQIGLPADAHTTAAWFVAGIRIDPGAPGLSPQIAQQFGRSPEIRLILQPITVSGSSVTIHDDAAHLVFDFVKGFGAPAQPGCAPQLLPDLDAFKSIVTDLVTFKSKLAAGAFGGVKVTTAGLPLGVHPGLANPITRPTVAQEMKAFLERHLPAGRLDAMSAVGVPSNAPVPWIFVSMALTPTGYVPVPSPTLDGVRTAMALKAVGSPNRVVPMPVTNNGAPITCKSAALGPNGLPEPARKGVSTANLFAPGSPDANTVRSVTATIADPARSHFFNTDCASCHTETRLIMKQGNPPDLDPAVLPKSDWVVRNFGWAPTGEGGQPSATRRAEAETRAVVDFLNAQPSTP